MKQLSFLLEKEFRQVFRNPAILRLVLIMPIIQLLIFPFAANYEVKNVLLSVVDHDHSSYSQKFISKITSSGYFILTDYSPTYNKAMDAIEADRADLIIEILSPGNSKKEMRNKFEIYEESGVKEYWIVNVMDKNVLIYTLNEVGKFIGQRPYVEDEIMNSFAFPELSVDLNQVFA